jgi:hypothetical protein
VETTPQTHSPITLASKFRGSLDCELGLHAAIATNANGPEAFVLLARVAARRHQHRARSAAEESLGDAAGGDTAEQASMGRAENDHVRFLPLREVVEGFGRRWIVEPLRYELRALELLLPE